AAGRRRSGVISGNEDRLDGSPSTRPVCPSKRTRLGPYASSRPWPKTRPTDTVGAKSVQLMIPNHRKGIGAVSLVGAILPCQIHRRGVRRASARDGGGDIAVSARRGAACKSHQLDEIRRAIWYSRPQPTSETRRCPSSTYRVNLSVPAAVNSCGTQK